MRPLPSTFCKAGVHRSGTTDSTGRRSSDPHTALCGLLLYQHSGNGGRQERDHRPAPLHGVCAELCSTRWPRRTWRAQSEVWTSAPPYLLREWGPPGEGPSIGPVTRSAHCIHQPSGTGGGPVTRGVHAAWTLLHCRDRPADRPRYTRRAPLCGPLRSGDAGSQERGHRMASLRVVCAERYVDGPAPPRRIEVASRWTTDRLRHTRFAR